jgi:hypothetical protein
MSRPLRLARLPLVRSGLNAPSLNLPFRSPKSLIYLAALSSIRIPYRRLTVGAISITVSSLVDFCEVPPLLSAFAHVPFLHNPSIRPCLSTP